jgi:DNA modification methylase
MDCIEGMKMLPDFFVNTIVTSPPYWGLRDYGVDGQIGLEQTPEEYVAKMVEVFREGKRVLRDDGTLWLNLGDCYSNTKAKPQQENWANTCGELNWSYNPSQNRTDLPPKNLVGIPWRVAFALQADGWYLRSDIIWSKPNPMPESVTDRPTKAHEYIFLLSKSERYYYDHEAIKEQAVYSPMDPANNWQRDSGKMTKCQVPCQSKIQHRQDRKRGEFGGKYADLEGRESFRAIRQFRNKRTVWTVSTKPFSEAHFATFPPDLIKPCILAGAPSDGIVLDPFMGAGTTGVTALELGRNYLGFELNKEYCEIAERRIETAKKRKEALGIPLFDVMA